MALYFYKSSPAPNPRRELYFSLWKAKQSAQYPPKTKQSLSSQKKPQLHQKPKSTVREIVRNGTSGRRQRKMGIKIPSISVQAVLYPDRLHELPLPFSQQRRRLHARKPHWSLSLSQPIYLRIIKYVLSVCLLRKLS